MSNDTGSTGVKRRDFLKVLGASSAAVATVGCSSEKVGKLDSVSRPSRRDGRRRLDLLRHDLPRVRRRLRRHRRDARRARRSSSRAIPSIRSIAARSARAASRRCRASTIPIASAARWSRKAARGRRSRWDDALTLLSQKLGEARSRGGAANAVFLNQHETGSFPALPRRVARRLRHAAAPQRRLRGRQRRHRGEPRSVRRGVAVAVASRTRSSSSRSAPTSSRAGACRVPQQLDFADARAKLDERAALRLHRTAPLAHRSERRPVDRVQAGHRARHRQRARRQGSHRRGGDGERRRRGDASAPAAGARRGEAGARALRCARRQCARRRAGRRRAQPGERRRRHDDPSRRGDHGFEASRAPATSLAAVERMRAGQVPIAFVRGANPAYSLPAGGASSPRRSRRCRSRSASRSIPDETTELCDLDPPRSALARVVGRRGGRCAARSSLQQPAMDPVFAGTRATADVLIAGRAEGSGERARSTRRRTIAAG